MRRSDHRRNVVGTSRSLSAKSAGNRPPVFFLRGVKQHRNTHARTRTKRVRTSLERCYISEEHRMNVANTPSGRRYRRRYSRPQPPSDRPTCLTSTPALTTPWQEGSSVGHERSESLCADGDPKSVESIGGPENLVRETAAAAAALELLLLQVRGMERMGPNLSGTNRS